MAEVDPPAATPGNADDQSQRDAQSQIRRRVLEEAWLAPPFRPVATKNPKCAEKSGVFEFTDGISPACLRSCDRWFLGLLADSIVGRLWNQRTSRSVTSCTFFAASGRVSLRLFAIDRLLWVLALPTVAALSGVDDIGDDIGEAGHRRPMAPPGLPFVLAMALEIRAAVSRSRDSRSDSVDEQRQPAVGCAPDQR